MDPWYRERRPDAGLARELACTWEADVGGSPRTLIPDGCLDLLWVDRGTVWLCGPETTAWSFSLPPGTTAVGVRFLPGVAPRLLGLDASEIRNQRIDLGALWGDGPARRLNERIGDEDRPRRRVAVLEELVRRRRSGAPPSDGLAALVAARVAGPRPASVAGMAAELGLSERQLHRRSLSAFGYGPTVLSRILRFQRFLAIARGAGRPAGLAELALAAGYADQSHLTREARAIAGASPTALLEAA